MLLKFEAEAKSLRLRPKGPRAKAEAEAKILASRSVWHPGFTISVILHVRTENLL